MSSDKTTSEIRGDRIAKVIARAGIASRRDAERMILEGRVTVNGRKIDSPALDVRPDDRITVDGKPIDAPQPTRLWLYYKPLGLVTSARDEKGRQTVFDTLPEGMPRVMSVGRLDLNSEGLLLLTNDGELKRRLELPSTGWLRKYRVRVNGRPTEQTVEPLRKGITIDGENFQPMEVTIDRQQGANAWLTVGIREGRNREIRRAMAEVGLVVNRLIRISYGPFRLNTMQPGDVVEVRARIMREQLGGLLDGLPGARVNARAAAAGDGAAKPKVRAGKPRAKAAGTPRPARPETGKSRDAQPARRAWSPKGPAGRAEKAGGRDGRSPERPTPRGPKRGDKGPGKR